MFRYYIGVHKLNTIDPIIKLQVESFVAEGEDHNMLTDYLDPKSLFHVAVLNGKLSGTETGALEEMEIENLVDTAPVKPPPSKGKRNGRGVTEVGGPSGPKKPKTVGEEGVPIDVPIPADPRQVVHPFRIKSNKNIRK